MFKNAWSEKDIELLKSKYGKIKFLELRNLFLDKSISSIRHRARVLGLKADKAIVLRKIPPFNEDFFKNPNPINCYWAGFIAADGSVNGERELYLYQKDPEPLIAFQKTIDHQGNIYKHRKPNTAVQHILCVVSKIIVDDLKNLFNIVKAKSLILNPPENLDEKCSLAFIIGYIDGDGCISLYKDKTYFSVSILGTLNFLKWVEKVFGEKSSITTKNNRTWVISFSHRKAVRFLDKLDSVKEVSDIKMKRKWDKFEEWKIIKSIH